ncbi:hypothetical protein BEH_07455 [Priestia filamentosa]|uniref:Uncharacterized protein n=1 Tax=Priestia filamentosa TaxID=1402861 RepID=A0A0H4KI26_9BACI|nr:hypothetical protein [Priestia filamentosa]AKO91949.1 hypothetical protein BEH_07455 [Priestia filamentosa]
MGRYRFEPDQELKELLKKAQLELKEITSVLQGDKSIDSKDEFNDFFDKMRDYEDLAHDILVKANDCW